MVARHSAVDAFNERASQDGNENKGKERAKLCAAHTGSVEKNELGDGRRGGAVEDLEEKVLKTQDIWWGGRGGGGG